MLPNVGLASASPSTASERIDAATLGARGRVVVIASASTSLAGARTRGIVRSVVQELEHAVSALDASHLIGAVSRQIDTVRDSRELSILVANANEQHQMVIATTAGMYGYRFREDAIAQLMPPRAQDPMICTDDTMPGDAYVFCTEGVRANVSEAAMLDALRADYHPRSVAAAIVEFAGAPERGTDATCVVSRPIDRRAVARPERAPSPPRSDDTWLRGHQRRLESLLEELRGMSARAEAVNPTGFSAGRFSARIVEIEEALARIRQGVYGRCIRCSATIAPARLDARPDDLRCGSCARS